jgi:hypothetical protein
MTERTVELIRPGPQNERFDVGERIIVVDGVRWGRTIVQSKGPLGQIHRFHQDGGEGFIMDVYPPSRFNRFTEVRSLKMRMRNRDFRTTEEAVLAKARELVADGLLRDPAIVRREHAVAAEGARLEAYRKAELKLRAFYCIPEDLPITQEARNALAASIVQAMEWAMEWERTK